MALVLASKPTVWHCRQDGCSAEQAVDALAENLGMRGILPGGLCLGRDRAAAVAREQVSTPMYVPAVTVRPRWWCRCCRGDGGDYGVLALNVRAQERPAGHLVNGRGRAGS